MCSFKFQMYQNPFSSGVMLPHIPIGLGRGHRELKYPYCEYFSSRCPPPPLKEAEARQTCPGFILKSLLESPGNLFDKICRHPEIDTVENVQIELFHILLLSNCSLTPIFLLVHSDCFLTTDIICFSVNFACDMPKTWSLGMWLLSNAESSVNFRLAHFVYSSLSGQAPLYMADDIHLVSEGPRRRLHSSTDRSCAVPHTHNIFGDRSFAAAGWRVWNSLPAHLRDEDITCNSLGMNWKCIGFNVAFGAQCDILLNCTI